MVSANVSGLIRLMVNSARQMIKLYFVSGIEIHSITMIIV